MIPHDFNCWDAKVGTTLVEQIISSHSEVIGAGELDHVSKFGLNLSMDPALMTNTEAISKFRNR